MQDNDFESKIESLLTEYDEHRTAIKDMIKKLEEIKENVDVLIPTTLDKRFARLFEEKVKAISNLFGTLLEMRKEIAKSIKDEIELRRRLNMSGDDLDEVEKNLDLRKLSEKVEDFKKQQADMKKAIEEKTNEEIPEGVEVPGVNVSLTS